MMGVWSAIINSQFVRIFIVVFLIIILQIPSLMIGGAGAGTARGTQ